MECSISRWLSVTCIAAVTVAGTLAFGSAAADSGDLFFGDTPALEDGELASNSGGSEVAIGDLGINVSTNSATVTGNTVNGTVTTGTISENTLNDVSGINSLMYNTGNNVNFQSNMQINVFLK